MTDLDLLSRPGSKAGNLQRVALEHLREKEARGEIPTSIRFVFYEAEQAGRISKLKRTIKPGCKTARTSAQDLTDAVTRLRELGLVPWDWIVDEGRQVDDYSVPHATVLEAIASMAEHVRINPWVGTLRPVVIAESRGVAGVVQRRFAYVYAIPVVGLGGNCRGFLETLVADLLRAPDTRVLYIGDADDCGNAIERHTRSTLARATGREFGPDAWKRLAITPEQVAVLVARGVQPILKRDDRYGDGNPHEAFEAEALGQSEIERGVRAYLDALLPEPLAAVQERADREREAVRRALARIAR